MATAVVSIGRNQQGRPMSAREWSSFRSEVETLVTGCAEELYTIARSAAGHYEGAAETSAIWVFAPRMALFAIMRRRLASLAHRYLQDGIALTLGETELIDGSSKTAMAG